MLLKRKYKINYKKPTKSLFIVLNIQCRYNMTFSFNWFMDRDAMLIWWHFMMFWQFFEWGTSSAVSEIVDGHAFYYRIVLIFHDIAAFEK